MRRKAQVHMLPTDKKGVLWLDLRDGDDCELIDFNPNDTDFVPQHLYFTTDEEIKEGDWYISNQAPRLCVEIRKGEGYNVIDEKYPYGHKNHKGEMVYDFHTWKTKIVATTNPDLWYKHSYFDLRADAIEYSGGVGKIGEDFIQAYVKAEGEIKEVELEYENEERKVRTLSKYPEYIYTDHPILKLRNNGTVIIHPVQQKMYTRQELIDACYSFYGRTVQAVQEKKPFDTKEWFDENYPE